ncbi:Mov34/MPN/PAD-1 family protein [Coccidioides posadasii C735 delta SOWgp]|uniref:Eukaryotic translation initiation factor 3 subunit F n=1 Tax=Coccidioides posadasii (strain C735) TaxID=222929 RepID=C5P5Z3_COCP7|nr:Mov34/MPN/PAD-1 family protein [Coccidioides posadasii C735 delta SOWgp]EER28133.1 Mov34/MPN/PAD-1 family protein [Coccidioides posadasii C735 delta SOWgp]|eukprot:XP_003070278.1 Mov34/MPN/PAD-1 family protein [Coccidioides posadasii C735 delta SOWgp]
MADTGSFIHLARPLGPATVGVAPSTAPLNVVIQPQAIFSILDHSLRRNADQERVIGTLLGTRSEDGTEVEIRTCFAVGHTETTDQVEVDMEYQKQMLALHLKANPKEVLVGWYATSSELNTFSALIQNFYGGQGDGTWPHPAVHLTVSTEPGKDIETRTYISAPVGVTAERAADSAAFIPVPYEIRYSEAERNGLEAIAQARDAEDRASSLFTDIETLEKSIEEVLGMIDRVSKYVESVIDEEAPASTALGQFLLNALALAPKVDPADIETTNTSKTSSSFRISQILSVPKWNSPTGWLPPSSPLEVATVRPLVVQVLKAEVSVVASATTANEAASNGIKLRNCEHNPPNRQSLLTNDL